MWLRHLCPTHRVVSGFSSSAIIWYLVLMCSIAFLFDLFLIYLFALIGSAIESVGHSYRSLYALCVYWGPMLGFLLS